MATDPDNTGKRRWTCLHAEPTQLATQQQVENWHRFLRDFVLTLSGSDSVVLVYGDAYDSPVPIPGSQESTVLSPDGKTYRTFELPAMTAEIFDEHIIGALEFFLNIDLFIWKPRTQIQDPHIQEIIEWRDAMFHQPIPFSAVIPTKKCIGFPAADGECFYWANPDVPLSPLKSIAKAYAVEITDQSTP